MVLLRFRDVVQADVSLALLVVVESRHRKVHEERLKSISGNLIPSVCGGLRPCLTIKIEHKCIVGRGVGGWLFS